MKAKIKAIYNTVLPNKRINSFILVLFIIGFLTGAFFLTVINTDEKTLITTKITNFITNINNNTLNSISIFKDNIITNYIFIFILWFLGLSIIGVFINIFLVYLRGFILGFTISSIILTYKAKGLLFNLIYIVPNELIKILLIILLGTYSVSLSISIVKELLKKKDNNLRRVFKRYIAVLILSLILGLLTASYEAFILPNLFNLIY